MAATYPEDESFSVYWKVKNASFCCKSISTSEFKLAGDLCRLSLIPESHDFECGLEPVDSFSDSDLKVQISILTCDGTQEESTSGNVRNKLRVPRGIIFGERRDAFLPEDTLTIRVRYLTETGRGNLFIYANIGVKRKYFIWTFREYSKHRGSKTETIESSALYGRIQLRFESEGIDSSSESIQIEISREGGELCFCLLKIDMLDADGKALKVMSEQLVFDDNMGYNALAFSSTKRLLAYADLILPQDTLSLKCECSVSVGKVTDETYVTSYFDDVVSLQKQLEDLSLISKEEIDSESASELRTGLEGLLGDKATSDVSICVGSDTIRAHKSILSARSPFFRAMFTRGVKEAIDNKVTIEDVSAQTIRSLLLYMYTDSIRDEDLESVKELYGIADKYEVLTLKKKCFLLRKQPLHCQRVRGFAAGGFAP